MPIDWKEKWRQAFLSKQELKLNTLLKNTDTLCSDEAQKRVNFNSLTHE